MKTKKRNLKKSYVLFDYKDQNFVAIVKQKKKITGDYISMLHPLQIVKYYKDILTKKIYEEASVFSEDGHYFTKPTGMFIDEDIANKIQENNVTDFDFVKILNNAAEYRKSL